jgi:gluconokinase
VTRVLAFDVGTSSVRACVFAEGAAETGAVARRDYPGENDPDRLVAAVRAVKEELSVGDPEAVGCSSFGHSLLPLDARGNPLTPVLGWRDTRSAAAADRLAERLDPEAVHARTGCHIHTSYWPAKLAWLAEEQPDVIRAARRFVSFADYLYMQLLELDDVPASLSLASGTGLLDLETRSWDSELLELLALDPECLPQIDDGAVAGWYPALHDGTCANVGAGCVSRERAALTVGTSGAFRTVYETETPSPRRGLFLYRVDGRRVVEGGSVSDGGNVYAWILETLEGASGSLAGRDPDSHGLTFVTLLGGERSLGWHTHAKGLVHGLTFETTPLDLKQAALEGIAFRFAQVVEVMPEVEEIVATGGALLNDDDWLQIMADALARPLIVSGVREASLRGAAVIALERFGETASEAPLGRVVEPRPDHADAYAAARERQRALYRVATGAETS